MDEVLVALRQLERSVRNYGTISRAALTRSVLDRAQRVVQKFNRLIKSQPKFELAAKAHPREGKKWFGYEQHDFIVPPTFGIHTLEEFKKSYTQEVTKFINQQLSLKGPLKIEAGIVIHGRLREEPHDFGCSVDNQTILSKTDVSEYLAKIFKDFQEKLDGTSYFQTTRVSKLILHISKYEPLTGSTYCELPPLWQSKKAIVNVQNKDNQCAKWALLSALFPAEKNPQRLSNYKRYESEVDFTGIKFPVKYEDWRRIELKNSKALNGRALDLYLAGNTRDSLVPLCVSKSSSRERLQFLLYSPDDDKNTGHYVWVKNLDRLINHQGSPGHTCMRCLFTYRRKEALLKHTETCVQFEPAKIKMPDPGSVVKFTNHYRSNRMPVVAYCDFECPNAQDGTQTPGSWAITLSIQDGVRIRGLDRICTYTKGSELAWFYYCGPDASAQFLRTAKEISRCCFPAFKFHDFKEAEDIQWTPETRSRYDEAHECEYCQCEFSKDDPKVPDHNHLTGDFRAALHQSCNLIAGRQEDRRFIPFIFHNLKGYDGHHIIRAIGADRFNEDKIQVIATSAEKYLSFTVIPDDEYSFKPGTTKRRLSVPMRFIDSLQFISASLDELISNVVKNPHRESRGLSGLHNSTVQRKGVFPYDWDWWSHLDDTCLPPKEAFYSRLSESHISDADYDFAQEVWNREGCRTFGDYHDLYLRVDVGGLHDAFETFRDLCLKYYGLDPVYYYGLPGYGWDVMLKVTNVCLPLLSDPDMYQFFEKGIRGGISVQSQRHAVADETTHIQYWDANNLYGHAMSQELPCGDFAWMETHKDLTKFIENCVVEIDIHTPPTIHDMCNEYPIPEKMVVSENLISPKSREFLGEDKFIGGQKLVGHLMDKHKYVVHGKLLNYWISQGHKVTKVHRGISFSTSTWLVPYIEMNRELRSQTTVDFERDVFKLMNNAVFGKTMEDVRKYSNFYLVRSGKQWKRTVNRPDFKSSIAFGEHVSGVFRHKTEVLLNKPIYVGQSVLDLSKLHMFKLHYDVVKPTFGDRARLLMTDTDSLVYEIKSPDLISELKGMAEHFDFSNLPTDHPLYDPRRKDVVGLLKDEFKGQAIREFIGLRSKMYSVLTCDGKSKAKAKGIPKSVTKRTLPHDKFRKALFDKDPCSADFHQLVSKKHIVSIAKQTKKALSAYDDKRYINDDGMTTLAYGHYSLCN
jgi:hypothetical protein